MQRQMLQISAIYMKLVFNSQKLIKNQQRGYFY